MIKIINSQLKEKVLTLLWSGDPDTAKKLISEEKHKLEEERQKLDATIKSLDSLLPPGESVSGSEKPSKAAPEEESKALPPSHTMSDMEIEERRQMVASVAISVAKREGGKFGISQVIEQLDANDYDLRVSENRAATAIGSILKRTGLFKRIGTGLYEYDGQDRLDV